MRRVSRFLAALWLFFLPASLRAQSPHVADVVIMLDLSSSISFKGTNNLFDQERAAALALLRTFQGAIGDKPYIAVGGFDVLVDGEEAARIFPHGSLSAAPYGNEGFNEQGIVDDSYTSGLFYALEQVDTFGGKTDLSAAINIAQQHLDQSASPGSRRFIVLITDGIPNRPGDAAFGICNDCGCDAAYDAARVAARASTVKGTQIVTLHYQSSTSCTASQNNAPAFLRQEVASPGLYFEAGSDLSAAFTTIAGAILCDRGDRCHVGKYNSERRSCEYRELSDDSDGDGIPDCRDQCRGDDAMLGAACQGGAGFCAGSGSFTCGADGAIVCSRASIMPELEICDGIDNDCNGKTDELDCLECRDTSADATISDIRFATLSQLQSDTRLLKFLSRRAMSAKRKRFVRARGRAIHRYAASLELLLQKTPTIFRECKNVDRCQQISTLTNASQLRSAANRLNHESLTLANYTKLFGRGTRRRGSALRTLSRRSYRTIASLAQKLPSRNDHCT